MKLLFVSENYKFILSLIENYQEISIDIGGGFPAFSSGEKDPIKHLENFARELREILIDLKFDISKVRLILEPGRILTEDFGYLVLKTIDTKERRNKSYAVLNGSTLNVRSLNKQRHDIIFIGEKKKYSNKIDLVFVGNNCFENDIFFSISKYSYIITSRFTTT